MRNWTHHVAGTWQNPITSRRRWQRDQTPIQKQTKHRTQQTKHRAQRCLSKKKKKSPIHKPKPNPITHRRSRHRRRRHSELVVVVVARPVALHRRSEIGEHRSLCLYSDARCSLRPSLKVFRFFSLWLSLSLSLFISLKLKWKWIANRHHRRRHRLIALPLRLYLCFGERCSLLPSAVRPSLKVFLSDSLSDS